MLIDKFDIAQLQETGNKLVHLVLDKGFLGRRFSGRFSKPRGNRICEQALNETFDFIKRREHLLKFFPRFAKTIHSADVYKGFECFFIDLFATVLQFNRNENLHKTTVLLSDINTFEVPALKHTMPNNASLENIVSLFNKNRNFFELVVLNGSLGSNDYIAGWSDVDIFAVIKDEVFCNMQQVHRLQKVMYAIKCEMYNYLLLQLHGIFFCLGSDFLFHRDKFFPLVCLKEGKLIIRPNKPSVNFWECETIFQNDACEEFEGMRSNFMTLISLKKKSILTKIRIIHRLFLFPVFCLALKKIKCYKRESYDLLSEYEDELPEIKSFCKKLKSIYHTMCLSTGFSYHLRVLATSLINPVYSNNLACHCERKIAKDIDELYARFEREGLFEQMKVYLFSYC